MFRVVAVEGGAAVRGTQGRESARRCAARCLPSGVSDASRAWTRITIRAAAPKYCRGELRPIGARLVSTCGP